MIVKKIYNFVRNIRGQIKLNKNLYNEAAELADSASNFLHPLSHIMQTREEISKYLFDSEKELLVKLDNPTEVNSYAGCFFKRVETNINNSSSLHIASEEEILNANVLAIGGIDFNTPRHLSALIKASRILASECSNKDTSFHQTIAVMPEVSKEERYEAAKLYYQDSSFYPLYIKNRVEKFLIPKIILDEDTVLNIPKSISLFSFSLGGREIMMMENALYDVLLKQYSIDPDTINTLMRNISAVCLGFAPKLNILEKNSGFNKIIIFSAKDRAVLLPKDFYQKILSNDSVLDQEIFYSVFNEPDDNEKHLMIYNKEISNHDIKDELNHTLGCYLYDINSFPEECKEVIGDYLVYHKE